MSLLVLLTILNLLSTTCGYREVLSFDEKPCLPHEYFDAKNLGCAPCDYNNRFHVPSSDRMSCVCDKSSIQIGWHRAGFPLCQKCKVNEVPTEDLRFCISCDKNNVTDSHVCFPCMEGSIQVERTINGTLLERKTCIPCSPGTRPDHALKKCVSCPLSMPECTCSLDTHSYVPEVGCVPKSVIISWPKTQDMYYISYDIERFHSKLFEEKLLPVLYRCKMNHRVSCQFLGNMCALNLYQDSIGGPCSALKDSRTFTDVPKLYYAEGDAPSVLFRKTLNQRFTLDAESETSYLSFFMSKWHLNGTWIGYSKGLDSLELCPLQHYSEKIRYASEYLITCSLPAKQIIKKSEPIFYDIYLYYSENNSTTLHALPVRILNYKHHKKYVNKAGDMSQWQLTQRIFDVDTVGGYKPGYNTSFPFRYRFIKSITLSVNVRDGQEGLIYPPLLSVYYGELSQLDVDKNINVKISMKVHFSKPDYIKKSYDISLAILCSLSSIWSIIRTLSNSKRSGQRAIDLVTVLHLCIVACGHLANVFFLICASAAVHSFIYYKWQITTHVLLPSARLNYYIRTYIIVAFPLKIVEILYMLWYHLNIDIFLIDWEQPRIQKQQTFSVSAWRTYFVSNKWNEIQTERRTSLLLQICITVLFLKVWGFENWAICVPELHTTIPTNLQFYNNTNKVHRVAVGVLVYCTIYFIQVVFISTLYERYIKNPIQEFVDFCSLANISVFMLSLENYGYYIHGRSAHGFSDTDMATLKSHLRREEEDLVGHRGLLPASDHQTFRMLIPPKLRTIYYSLLPYNSSGNPNFNIAAFMKDGKAQIPNTGGDHRMQAYVTINRFLAAFIEHALKDLDYEVKEKLFVESLFDVELWNAKDKGTLYFDNGHSFDNVLYYGNELTLFTFNLIVFSFVEVLSQDFLLAAIITILSDEVVARLRKFGARKNFSRKTLIYEQFLL